MSIICGIHFCFVAKDRYSKQCREHLFKNNKQINAIEKPLSILAAENWLTFKSKSVARTFGTRISIVKKLLS